MSPILCAARAGALALALGANLSAHGQPAPVVSQAVSAPTPSLAAAGGENAEELSQTATLIARLRQQQAVVEAQAALAKANAELAHAQQQIAQPAATDPTAALSASLAGMPNRDMRLLGVSGSPQQRIATLEMPDGNLRDVRAGAVLGAWVVHEVRLGDVVLRPRARGNVQRTLLDDGSVRDVPYTSPAPAQAAAKSRKP